MERFGDGLLDQRGRRFTSSEYRIAQTLARQGYHVVAVAESRVFRQKSPDAYVDGEPTEFKTLDPGATHQTVNDCLGRARNQAPNVVVDGRGSGLTEHDARRGLARFVGAHAGRARSIRVLGDGFETTLARRSGGVAVSRSVDVFIDANESAEQIRRVLAGALGGQFRPSDDGNPYLPVGARTVIYAGPHEFTDAAGAPVSQYAHWIEVRDLDRDHARQLRLARRVFDAAVAVGRWRVVLIDDMQHLVASYQPTHYAQAR